MFQIIMKLYDTRATQTNQTNGKGKYIYFGGSIIFCDDKNVCSIYEECNNINTKCVETNLIPTIVSSI